MSISGIIDIAFVAILIILAIIGLTRGFLKSALAMVSSLVSMVIAYFAAKPLGQLIDKLFKTTNVFASKITKWLNSVSEFFSITRNGESFTDLSGQMSSSGVDGAVQRLAKAVLGSANIPDGKSVGQVLGQSLGNLITVVIGGVVAFILIRVILKVLEHFSSKITQVRIFGVVDKLLGFVFGLAKGLIYTGLIFVCMSILSYIKPIDNKMTPIMDDTKIAQKYYDWIDYETQDFLNDKFFKKSPNKKPSNTATAKTIDTFEAILGEVNRAYVDLESSRVYMFESDAEVTSNENINKNAKYFVAYTEPSELTTILEKIDAFATATGGHLINVDNRPTSIAAEKTFDYLTAANLASVTQVYLDWENEVAYFKVDSAEIDVANYLTDVDFYIDFTADKGGAEIKTKIQELVASDSLTITITESTAAAA